jgi:butyryl-CoA dehydrogenase
VLRTRAERAGDGTYRITGTKIYITYGEHDLTDNIVHLVLARLPDAPPGTRGISLFLVPKILPDGTANDLRCAGIEHKLGIHGSPTCTMAYGDHGGAVGWLIGEENRGLACMFTMMNNARLNVGLQGVAIAERAYQGALAYAKERRQGRGLRAATEGGSPIVEHPDVQRNLLTMKALTWASRAICYLTAAELDRARLLSDEASRKAANDRASLLTPIAKAFSTDNGIEVASIGVQVHGGMGFVEETGAAQHMRDARILAIYEGTNGIQAIDLATRKLPLAGSQTVRAEIAAMRASRAKSGPRACPGSATPRPGCGTGSRASTAQRAFSSARWPGATRARFLPAPRPISGCSGSCGEERRWPRSGWRPPAATGRGDNDPAQPARIAVARFFAENLLTAARGLEDTVTAGGGFLDDAPMALAS